MARNIFWKNLSTDRFDDNRIRLFVELAGFRNGSQPIGEWTPRWSEVSALVNALVEVERQNCSASEYLEKLQAMLAGICSRLRSAANARSFVGRLCGYEVVGGTAYAEIEVGELVGRRFVPSEVETIALGIPLTDADLREMLIERSTFLWVAWNGIVIHKAPTGRQQRWEMSLPSRSEPLALSPA
jgi:hypothetical protein